MKILFTCIAFLSLWCSALGCSVGTAQDAAPSWPLEIQHGESRILLYQLQPESLTGDELTARAAVSIARGLGAEPRFGAVWIEARIATDRATRTVSLLDVRIP